MSILRPQSQASPMKLHLIIYIILVLLFLEYRNDLMSTRALWINDTTLLN